MAIKFLNKSTILAMHDEQISEHGGGQGVRSQELLESALSRPKNLEAYETPSVVDLAASYGYGLIKNHPFVDGNKRVAFLSIETFLLMNDMELEASDADCTLKTLDLAAGNISEKDFSKWLAENCNSVA